MYFNIFDNGQVRKIPPKGCDFLCEVLGKFVCWGLKREGKGGGLERESMK
jgi:hypothetical protein